MVAGEAKSCKNEHTRAKNESFWAPGSALRPHGLPWAPRGTKREFNPGSLAGPLAPKIALVRPSWSFFGDAFRDPFSAAFSESSGLHFGRIFGCVLH